MVNRISEYLWNMAGRKWFFIALVGYLLMGAVVMPLCAKLISDVAGKPTEILDLQFGGYTKERAQNIIAAYGDEGRALVVKVSAIADSIYPIAYTFFFVITIAWIYKAGNRHGVVYNHLHLFPFLIMVVDYCENFFLIRMIGEFPNLSERTVLIASFFTNVKWSMVVILLLMFFGGLGLLLADKLKNRRNSA